MLVRVQYDPTKGLDHRYIPGLPTWGMVGYDPIAETMVVQIPDDDWPPDEPITVYGYVMKPDDQATIDQEPRPVGRDTHLGPVVYRGSSKFHKAWHAHLAKRYEVADTEFTPQLG